MSCVARVLPFGLQVDKLGLTHNDSRNVTDGDCRGSFQLQGVLVAQPGSAAVAKAA